MSLSRIICAYFLFAISIPALAAGLVERQIDKNQIFLANLFFENRERMDDNSVSISGELLENWEMIGKKLAEAGIKGPITVDRGSSGGGGMPGFQNSWWKLILRQCIKNTPCHEIGSLRIETHSFSGGNEPNKPPEVVIEFTKSKGN